MKRLYRSKKERMISGVCGGIAEYFNVDPVIIRILCVLMAFMGGSAIIAYIIAIIVIPEANETVTATENQAPQANNVAYSTQAEKPAPQDYGKAPLIIGIVLVFFGFFFMMEHIPGLHHVYAVIEHHFWDFLIPGILIITGLLLVLRNRSKEDDKNS